MLFCIADIATFVSTIFDFGGSAKKKYEHKFEHSFDNRYGSSTS